MFSSALDSVLGSGNSLGFQPTKSACVVLVDGLGSANIRSAAGHARFLNRALKDSRSISCGFPSTTAVSITGFGTGLPASQHGIFGYKVVDPKTGIAASMLSDWNGNLIPEEWQPHQTVAERAAQQDIESWFVGPGEYEDSGFTRVSMRGSSYAPAKTIRERFEKALELLNKPGKRLIYLYVPELDQLAHAFGVGSDRWLAKLEQLDAELEGATRQLPKACGLVLTADHGVIDVPRERHVYLDELALATGIKVAAGDPRCIFAYLENKVDIDAWVAEAAVELSKSCWVASTKDWIAAGWFGGAIDLSIQDRLPQAIIVARATVALYDRRTAPVKSLDMVGQHGGVSDVELQIPLLRWQV